MLAFTTLVASAGVTATPSQAGTDPGSEPGSVAGAASPGPSASPDASFGQAPSPMAVGSPAPLASPALLVDQRMPFVPVVGFWSTDTTIRRPDLVAALTGRSNRFTRVLVPTADRDTIAAVLGITIADTVEVAEPAAIERAVRARGVLGVVRATDVTFRVRALGIGAAGLFGNDRIRDLDDWPLTGSILGPADQAWDQRTTWTLVAGGDSFTDRGIYERVVNRGKGVDYPFSGGRARVTGHYCCGPYVAGNKVPRYVLSGPKGLVRKMTKGADLAILNHESPIADNWVFHLNGYYFSGKPQLTEMFTRAGIDWVSLANNHIKDFGSSGIADTRKHLDRFGIRYSGAGRNIRQARELSILEAAGVRVAIIPCLGVAPIVYATKARSGATPCKNTFILPDIRKAREQADVVIVFPHWGAEYVQSPSRRQRALAASWVDAGADLVMGHHSHVAGAIEEFDGAPVFYSLGNFIFDQNWATYTMESFLLEATFHGDRIVQLRLHPFLTHDQAQPNFLDPAKDDGRALLGSIRRVSFIDW